MKETDAHLTAGKTGEREVIEALLALVRACKKNGWELGGVWHRAVNNAELQTENERLRRMLDYKVPGWDDEL